MTSLSTSGSSICLLDYCVLRDQKIFTISRIEALTAHSFFNRYFITITIFRIERLRRGSVNIFLARRTARVEAAEIIAKEQSLGGIYGPLRSNYSEVGSSSLTLATSPVG